MTAHRIGVAGTLVLGAWLFLLGAELPGQNARTRDQLLEQAEQGEGKEALLALNQALLLLAAERLPAGEVQVLSQRVARTLGRLARTPEEAAKALEPHQRRGVVREVLFRRYREVWLYEHPLPLRVVIEVERGQIPVLLEVQAGKVNQQ